MFSAHAFWPFGRLGIANYFLAIGYLIASGFALQQFLRVRSLVRTWNAHAVFHLGLLLMCISRTLSFGGLSFFAFSSVQDNDKLYPLYILLFTLPEFACLTIYSLLFFHWLEVFTFSHDQFAFSHSSFQRSWLTIAVSINFLLYSSQVVLYIMLYTTNVVNQDKISSILTWIVACTSLVLPFCFLIAFFVFATVILSGFPFLSALAQARVRKINFVFLIWTFGRVLRSAMLLLSLHQDWEAPLSDAVVSAIVTALLVLVEIVPFCLSLDWSTIAILLTSVNDNQHQLINGPGLFANFVDDVEHVSEHSKLFIDPALVQALEGAEAAQYDEGGAVDVGSFNDEFTSQFHARHATTGQLLLVKKFQLHEVRLSSPCRCEFVVFINFVCVQLGSTSVCDQYAEDLASWSNVDHPHVAKFVGVFRIGFDVFCCTEAQGKTLSSFLAHSSRPMPQVALIRIAKQLCRALNFLHTRRSPTSLDNLPAPSVGSIHKIGVGHGQLTPSSISVRYPALRCNFESF
jgi:hypothetical protein